MPVTDIALDPDALTMTLVADADVPVDRLWRAFTQPRQIERFWGPPGWPATFRDFDFTVGGRAIYYMTSPTGERHYGAWEFTDIRPNEGFEAIDAFIDEAGTVNDGLPASRMTFSFTPTDTGSRLELVTHFASLDGLEQSLAMGMREGIRLAMGQLDAVVHDLRDYARGKGTRTEVLSDQHVRITRLIDGPRELVWRAHVEPELLRRWLLGPDGWRMTVCEIDPTAGGRYRYAWAPEEGTEGEPFGFDGEALLVEPVHRMVSTEHMTGTDFPTTRNDLSLYEEDGATLLTLLIEYPDAATRDTVLATGMTDGMEASYARLERVVAAE